MFYEVRIMNPDGTLKKVVSSKDLKTTHWDNFKKAEESLSLQNSDRPKVPKWVKETLDVQFVEFSDSNF